MSAAEMNLEAREGGRPDLSEQVEGDPGRQSEHGKGLASYLNLHISLGLAQTSSPCFGLHR